NGDVAHSGARSLKFIDVPGLSNHYYPYVAYNPILHDEVAKGRFSLYLEAGSILYYEWRDDRVPYRAGPSLWTDSAGNLKVNGATLMALPSERWVRFTVTCPLGETADGTFQLEVEIEGGPRSEFVDLPCANPLFERIDWLGI